MNLLFAECVFTLIVSCKIEAHPNSINIEHLGGLYSQIIHAFDYSML